MRLKPSPMTEASVIFSISWALTFLVFSMISMDVNQGLRASSISIFFLIISYILWFAAGWFVRTKNSQLRFFTNVTVNLLVAVGALLLIDQAEKTSTVEAGIRIAASGYLIGVTIAHFLTATVASALTQFLIVKPKKAKI